MSKQITILNQSDDKMLIAGTSGHRGEELTHWVDANRAVHIKYDDGVIDLYVGELTIRLNAKNLKHPGSFSFVGRK